MTPKDYEHYNMKDTLSTFNPRVPNISPFPSTVIHFPEIARCHFAINYSVKFKVAITLGNNIQNFKKSLFPTSFYGEQHQKIENWSEIVDSGAVVEHVCGSCVFKVILGSFSVLISEWLVTRKQLAVECQQIESWDSGEGGGRTYRRSKF